ncbi:FKBP-type peptidyl-prolyl cis-trans isomerase [Actinomycetospora chibensis]|uniref:Peptidyl-prolyl cis-trans isomerase n=1 Tax=Actinomycetospora chibensis TaxID=663606 RepID=A0ABV9RAU6_9PSEU|nr:FKBP-type peptidyl-prolyl cis-trans isomerase [Actinomycetospora chibensis]MDD7922128.1 FKBP-type peptidyl-prolyl cis-trans isomerase [Actinomycetospora chibensis]
MFPLKGVIVGFELGISGMREGGRRVLVVPPRQGYGARGVPPVPNRPRATQAPCHPSRR